MSEDKDGNLSEQWWHAIATKVTLDFESLPLPIRIGAVTPLHLLPTAEQLDAIGITEEPPSPDEAVKKPPKGCTLN